MRGYLISFEGIDGSGKSTQARLLTEYIRGKGRVVHLLREPGGTAIGERIRGLLLDILHADMCPHTELFLYLAARAQITSAVIKPALSKGEIVIMDRYIDSTTAYQGYARDLGLDAMKGLNAVATGGLVPDITFLVDCDPSLAMTRLSGAPDRLEAEGIAFMNKVREGFLKIQTIENDRIAIVDGARSIESISEDIIKILAGKLSEIVA